MRKLETYNSKTFLLFINDRAKLLSLLVPEFLSPQNKKIAPYYKIAFYNLWQQNENYIAIKYNIHIKFHYFMWITVYGFTPYSYLILFITQLSYKFLERESYLMEVCFILAFQQKINLLQKHFNKWEFFAFLSCQNFHLEILY